MKKTLLSMMTMAILASGSANAVDMDINVTAEIPHKVNMIPQSAGVDLSNAKLAADPNDDSKYMYTQAVTLKGNGNKSVNVRAKNALQLRHNTDNQSTLPINVVTLGGENIQTGASITAGGQDFVLTNGTTDIVLKIVADKSPSTTTGTYEGVLALELSETP
ncbi:CS1 type fimbrial major subunit [Yersinia artesiana]|uniref:CS1 type fimbrial major subunit n=1 Tax=Yersinia artesiana TaxID=2890315 RepID=UPI0015823EC2|nr:CS1 type fimbrial major subunit [Yersinia artesiana]